MAWLFVMLGLTAVLVLCLLWMIVEWVWSDAPKGKRRPWESGPRPEEKGAPDGSP